MPFVYVYSPSDFVGGLPAESGSRAAGSPTFTLTLVPGATPTLVEITDGDTVFNEVDSTQELTTAVNIDGTPYAAGTTIHAAYDLINTSTGAKVTSFHFGGNGYQQGAVDGLVSTEPLTAGTSYTFNVERTSYQQNNGYAEFYACFTAGTRIATVDGPVAVEALEPGQMVLTRDGGARPVRMVLSRRLGAADLAASPNMRPVRIDAGALGDGLPRRDLAVSPQHRMLVDSPIAKRMFGTGEVLVSACKLAGLPGIATDAEATGVTYYHLVMDRHEVVLAEGAPSESFYCGPMAVKALDGAARAELVALFPGLDAGLPAPARPMPRGAQQHRLVARHAKNAKPVLAPQRRSA